MFGGWRAVEKHWLLTNTGFKLVTGKFTQKIGGSTKVKWYLRNFRPEIDGR
jgi:hypothetical protein